MTLTLILLMVASYYIAVASAAMRKHLTPCRTCKGTGDRWVEYHSGRVPLDCLDCDGEGMVRE